MGVKLGIHGRQRRIAEASETFSDYVHRFLRIRVCLCAYLCACMHACVYVYIYVCVCVYECVRARVCTCANLHAFCLFIFERAGHVRGTSPEDVQLQSLSVLQNDTEEQAGLAFDSSSSCNIVHCRFAKRIFKMDVFLSTAF